MRIMPHALVLALPLLVLGCSSTEVRQSGAGNSEAEAAGWTPLQLSATSSIQLFSQKRSIHGLRLGLLAAQNRNLDGIDVAGGVAVVEGSLATPGGGPSTGLRGVQVAGLTAVSGGGVVGVQASPFACVAIHDLTGIQLGGGGDIAVGTVRGMQLGLGACHIVKDLKGIQVGGIGCTAFRNVRGIQVGGLILVTGMESLDRDPPEAGQTPEPPPDVTGMQVSGLWSATLGRLRGVQASLGFNTGMPGAPNDKEVVGAQLAGICNSAKRVKGIQIALFNRCDVLSGVQLGLLNISRGHRFPFVPFINVRLGRGDAAQPPREAPAAPRPKLPTVRPAAPPGPNAP